MTLRGSNPDVYVTGSDEIRILYHPLTSQNRASLLGVGSAPATCDNDVRENQSELDGRTHTTNTQHTSTGHTWATLDERQGMSAHVFSSLHPCFTQSGTYDGVGKQELVRHLQPLLPPVHHARATNLITPNITIERPDAHLADGPTQDVAIAKHRPYLRGFKEVFHRHKCFIYKCTAFMD